MVSAFPVSSFSSFERLCFTWIQLRPVTYRSNQFHILLVRFCPTVGFSPVTVSLLFIHKPEARYALTKPPHHEGLSLCWSWCMRGDYGSILQITRRRTFDNAMRSLVDEAA